jgi:hypothetical protein
MWIAGYSLEPYPALPPQSPSLGALLRLQATSVSLG